MNRLREQIEHAAGLFSQGQPRQALEVLRKVTSASPGMMRAQTLSARCWLALGHRDKALEHLAVASSIADAAPRPARVRANLTQFYVLAEDHDAALGLIERAIAEEPDNLDLRIRHGALLCGASRWRDALAIFETTVKRLPDHASLLKSTGIAAQMSGQLTRAVELYIRALAAGEPDRDVYANLIAVLIELGRIDEAHRHATQWLSMLPADIEAMAFVALLEVECGNDEAAHAWFDFARLVKGHTIVQPEGYASLDEFNRALEAVVLCHDGLAMPPGDLGMEINNDGDGPVKQLEQLMRAAVDRYFAEADNSDSHPFLAQQPDDYDIVARSAVLDGESNQKPHIHKSGYLSGCYYVTIQPEVSDSGEDNAGAVEMGRPPEELPFKAQFPVETVKPSEGLMLLFPAFMYHGTVPFKAKGKRICVAFDVIPKSLKAVA